MDQLAQAAAVLLVIISGFALILGGKRGARGLLGCVLSPFRALARGVVGTAAVLLLLILVVTALPRVAHAPGSAKPSPEPKPPATQNPKPVPPVASVHFDYPVGDPDSEGRRRGQGWYVSQDFADKVNPYSAERSGQHQGEDWLRRRGQTAGQAVYAIAAGKVIYARADKSYGRVVLIKHPLAEGQSPAYVISLYGHLAAQGVIAEGSSVSGHDRVGVLGERGDNGVPKGSVATDPLAKRSWPPHLHFELREPSHQRDDVWVSYGYSSDLAGFLNPTDATSRGNTPVGGWIDAHW